jgi:biotin operon repressor/DNA-binding CsgD family transcriptional regulator
MSDELKHYGMPRRSGRYPWGSGGDPYQRSLGWRGHIQKLQEQGLSDVEIAKREGITTTQLRARMTISKIEVRNTERAEALKLNDKGYSNTEIGRQMGKNESSIRNLLDPVLAERSTKVETTSKVIKEFVDKNRFMDVGAGVANHLGVTPTTLNNAVLMLKEQGYKVHQVNIDQLGMPGQFTILKALGTPDTEWKEILPGKGDPTKVKSITNRSTDFGETFTSDLGLKPIQSVDSKRVKVRYFEEGGVDKDGVIELRRGVKDLDLGGSKYAQVRIGVDGTHFLKGMAIYSDKMPDGVDIVFNTNKHDTGNKHDAMKKMKDDPDNPFGSTIKRELNEFGQIVCAQRGALNVVNEEGDWERWSKTISSQVLSNRQFHWQKNN